MKKTLQQVKDHLAQDNGFKSFQDMDDAMTFKDNLFHEFNSPEAWQDLNDRIAEDYKNQHTAPLIEALEESKKSKWIPVTESLPERRSYVVISYWSCYDVAEFKHGCFFVGLIRIDDVKYWMLLEDPEMALLNAKA